MLWQTNKIKHQHRRRPQLLQRRLHAAKADRAARPAMAVVKAVPVEDAAKVVPEDPADARAESGNFSARRKFVSSVSKRWT